METFLLVYKPIGLTPLQAIIKLKKLYPVYQNQKIGYAGRLDPMAEGLLLLLIGDENKKRKEYEQLSKEYEFEVLLGIQSDSYDALGLITSISNTEMEIENLKLKIVDLLNGFIGSSTQPYPPYSSARVNGKPLYYWARAGKINEIIIPKKIITVHKLKLNNISSIKLINIYTKVIERIKLIDGEFRQGAILRNWKEVVSRNSNIILTMISVTISCSSGTYVRSIANSIGTNLGVGAIALSIKRTKIGDHLLQNSLKI